ncbi:hypothetical protein [Eubacterium barkeri]|uniref:Uncharacterized protein n=1 Tax=Eubacterium barkeri TaxID=1528 RepID=A0A1H3INY2_EUBBA|nr:hypothetical protein [Eubacterium barkeri]SDY29543.1 hypothetical protein SAMN04488579_12429 [Eubacterium barkeri]
MQKIKMILLCLAIGWVIATVGIGSSVGLVIILAFDWPGMSLVLIGVAIVISVIVWVAYGRYQD